MATDSKEIEIITDAAYASSSSSSSFIPYCKEHIEIWQME
jgi:hypothetical protein